MRVGTQVLRIGSLESLRENIILRRDSDGWRWVRGRCRSELEVRIVQLVGVNVGHCSIEFGYGGSVCILLSFILV